MAKKAAKEKNTGTIGFEEKLWAAADKMRGHRCPEIGNIDRPGS
jgi:hypothetical protein